jgi:cytoplasmic iron level regulating protein YaaA (DUF328/UPF0246 family)
MKRLLIISCSARKLKKKRTTAIDLYRGVFFQVLKKALLVPEIEASTDILIISAKYGLLSCTSRVAYYEQRLNYETNKALKPVITDAFAQVFAANTYENIFVNLGKDYVQLISDVPELDSATYAHGGSGMRCQQLKQWLHFPHRA